MTDEMIKIINSKDKHMVVQAFAGCFPKDTRYFNGTEWKTIDEYTNGEFVLQFNTETRKGELVKPFKYIKRKNTSGWYRVNLKNGGHIICSGTHDILYYDNDYCYHYCNVKEVKEGMKILTPTNAYVGLTNTVFKEIKNVERIDLGENIEYCFEVPSGNLILRQNEWLTFCISNCGKSTTMLEYVKAHPTERILFLVYNKEMMLDFKNRLSGINHNCDVRTIHSLAYRWYLSNKFPKKTLGNTNIVEIQNILKTDFEYSELSKIKFYFDMFLTSSKDTPYELDPLANEDKKYFKYVDKLFKYYSSKYSVSMPHNVYLKMFQLSKVKLNYETLIQDECLDGDMFVKTDKGFRRIRLIHEAIQRGEKINVLSFNDKLKIFEYKEVIDSKETKNRDIYKLKSEGLNSLYCTENHRILTQRGYVRLDEIVVGKDQIILDKPENQKTKIKLNDDQYQMVIGSYLGDGYLHTRSKGLFPTYHLGFTQSNKQVEYMRMKSDCLNIHRAREHTIASGYTGIKNIHQSGMSTSFALDKFIDECLWDMDARALAIWFMDDGASQTNGVSYYANIDLGDKNIELIDKLKKILINNFNFKEEHIRILQYREKYHRFSFTKEGSTNFFKIVSKYIHPNLFYKLPKEYIPSEQYQWNNKFKNYGSNFVKNISYHKKGDVYDITVKDNHNFVTSYSYMKDGGRHEPTGIVVHNCNDLNYAMLDILITNLDKKIIAVGDSYQMINSFNFNCDGLEILEKKYDFIKYGLTKSFRVSDSIANMASKYLSFMYDNKTKFNGLGKTKFGKINLNQADSKFNQVYLLCRTRLGGLKQIVEVLNKDIGKKIYYVGGLDSFGFKEIERMLKYGGNIYIGNQRFHISELRAMLKDGVEDSEISRLVSVYTFAEKNREVINSLRDSEVKDKSKADIVLLTSHSSKGLTLNNVVLGRDFPTIETTKNKMNEKQHEYKERLANSEANLLYVALTRATGVVDIGQCFNKNSKINTDNKLNEILDY